MSRKVSILFIFLANMIILVHAAIPHHHHNRIFVAVVSMFDSDLLEFLNHSHDVNIPGFHGAIDDKPIVTLVSNLPQDCAKYLSTTYFFYAYDLFIAADNPDKLKLFPSELPSDSTPYIFKAHTDCIVNPICLRAPPLC